MSTLLIKIEAGTQRLSDEHLCPSCRFGRVVVDGHGEQHWCSYASPNREMTSRVYRCTRYLSTTLPMVSDHETLAWVLGTTGVGTKKIGFISPQEMARRRLAADLGDGPYAPPPTR